MKTVILIAIIVYIFKKKGNKLPKDADIKTAIEGRKGIISVLGIVLAFLLLC